MKAVMGANATPSDIASTKVIISTFIKSQFEENTFDFQEKGVSLVPLCAPTEAESSLLIVTPSGKASLFKITDHKLSRADFSDPVLSLDRNLFISNVKLVEGSAPSRPLLLMSLRGDDTASKHGVAVVGLVLSQGSLSSRVILSSKEGAVSFDEALASLPSPSSPSISSGVIALFTKGDDVVKEIVFSREGKDQVTHLTRKCLPMKFLEKVAAVASFANGNGLLVADKRRALLFRSLKLPIFSFSLIYLFLIFGFRRCSDGDLFLMYVFQACDHCDHLDSSLATSSSYSSSSSPSSSFSSTSVSSAPSSSCGCECPCSYEFSTDANASAVVAAGRFPGQKSVVVKVWRFDEDAKVMNLKDLFDISHPIDDI